MQIISIIILLLVGVYILFEMKKSKDILNNDWFQKLDRDDKIKVTKFLKKFWKRDIILISLLLGCILIVVSTLIGTGSNYGNEVSILAIFYSIISTIILILNKKKYYYSVNNFKR